MRAVLAVRHVFDDGGEALLVVDPTSAVAAGPNWARLFAVFTEKPGCPCLELLTDHGRCGTRRRDDDMHVLPAAGDRVERPTSEVAMLADGFFNNGPLEGRQSDRLLAELCCRVACQPQIRLPDHTGSVGPPAPVPW